MVVMDDKIGDILLIQHSIVIDERGQFSSMKREKKEKSEE